MDFANQTGGSLWGNLPRNISAERTAALLKRSLTSSRQSTPGKLNGCPDSYSSMARKCPVNGGVNGKIIKYHQIYQMKWEKK